MISTAREHRVGAALFKGSRLLSIGWNNTKTHPASTTRYNAQHAEFNCLIGQHKIDVCGATLFVVRLTKASNDGVSKPCEHCEKLIRAAGVRKVFYINRKNEIESMKL